MLKRKFKHLDLEERELMFGLLLKGYSFREIGECLDRPHTTISRELKRNAKYEFEYIPCRAQRLYDKRSKDQRSKAPLKKPKIFLYVREHLRLPYLWTPEQIAGRLPVDMPGESICFETIYRYIYSKETVGDKLWQYLPHQRKSRKPKVRGGKNRKSQRIKNTVPITKRPKHVQKRKSIGHMETDNMEGKREDKKVLSVTHERAARYNHLALLPNKKAQAKAEAVIDRLLELPPRCRKTITADNGSENANHEHITNTLNMPVYFCAPYHSWEKGSVERVIVRIRRFLPKGESLNEATEEQVQWIENWLNNMPLKCLQYKTPNERMSELIRKELLKPFN